MLLICENDISKVYDDGDNYRVVTKKMEDLLIPKKEDPYFPLACYLKWGFKAVNTEYLEKLTKTNSKNF